MKQKISFRGKLCTFRERPKQKITPCFSNDRELYFAGALVLLWLLVFLLTHLKHLNLHQ